MKKKLWKIFKKRLVVAETGWLAVYGPILWVDEVRDQNQIFLKNNRQKGDNFDSMRRIY